MPRIPVLDGPSVQSQGDSRSSGTLDNNAAGRAISQGVEDASRGLAYAADSIVSAEQKRAAEEDREAKAARARAEAIQQANADADYQRAETAALVGGSNRRKLVDDAFEGTGPSETLTPDNVQSERGFYGTRGLEAGEKSADTLDKLEQLRQDIAKKKFVDEEQRQKWLARSGGMYEDTRRKVETHAAQQFEVAQADALKGRLSTTLDALASDPYADPKLQLAAGEQAITALQKSPEGGAAAIQSFRAEVSKTRIDAFLSAGDVARAEQQFKEDSKTLGTEAPRVKAQIDQAKRGREIDAKIAQDETDATQIVTNATPPGGYVDENRALAAVDALPAGVRGGVRTQVLHRLAQEETKRKNDIADWRTTAYSKFNEGGIRAINGELLDRLNRFDPEFVHKLQSETESRWRRAKADSKESYAEQGRLNQSAMLDYMSRPLEERVQMNIDAEFGTSGADEKLGLKAIRAQQQKDKASMEKGESVKESAFVTDARSAGQGLYSTAKGSPEAKEFDAEAHIAYGEFVAKNQRVPNAKESQELIADVLVKQHSRPGVLNRLTGGLIPTTVETPGYKVRAAERKAAAKAPTMTFEEGIDLTEKKVSSYAYSPDKKQRRARYSDGTLGPPEQVP